MRRILHLVHVSLDGRICGPEGEFDWPSMGPELSAHSFVLQREDTTLLYGRRVWELMSSYWPRAEELSDHPHDLAYAPVWRAASKVVASRTLDAVSVAHTALVRSVEEIAALKEQEGGDILLMGGAVLAGALSAAGLVDELQVAVHPVVLGGEHAMLPPGEGRFAFTLRESRVCDESVVLSTYDRA